MDGPGGKQLWDERNKSLTKESAWAPLNTICLFLYCAAQIMPMTLAAPWRHVFQGRLDKELAYWRVQLQSLPALQARGY